MNLKVFNFAVVQATKSIFPPIGVLMMQPAKSSLYPQTYLILVTNRFTYSCYSRHKMWYYVYHAAKRTKKMEKSSSLICGRGVAEPREAADRRETEREQRTIFDLEVKTKKKKKHLLWMIRSNRSFPSSFSSSFPTCFIGLLLTVIAASFWVVLLDKCAFQCSGNQNTLLELRYKSWEEESL